MKELRLLITFIIFLTPIIIMIYLSLNYSTSNIIFLSLILLLTTSAFASPGIIASIMNMEKYAPTDLALTGVFAGLIYISNFILIIFPSFIFYVIPFAAGLTFYFPTAIIFGAYITLTNKPGASFSLILSYGIVSEIFSPSIFWFPYYLGWGGLIESVYLTIGKIEKRSDLALMGFAYGEVGAAFAVCYMMIGWGYYRPLFFTLPSAIADGILAALGMLIGYKIGLMAKSVPI
ncbi:MAG: hypothetical protein ACP6IP_09745 [Candidatus Njordarchaeia archaeon]